MLFSVISEEQHETLSERLSQIIPNQPIPNAQTTKGPAKTTKLQQLVQKPQNLPCLLVLLRQYVQVAMFHVGRRRRGGPRGRLTDRTGDRYPERVEAMSLVVLLSSPFCGF